MKLMLNVILFFFGGCGLLFSADETFDLQFTHSPKLKFNYGSLIFDPLIGGADNFSVHRYFKFENIVNPIVGEREWVCFTREENELTDAMISIKTLEDGGEIKKANLIEIKRVKSEVHIVIYEERGENFTPFAFSCDLADAIDFVSKVEKMNTWVNKNFAKESK